MNAEVFLLPRDEGRRGQRFCVMHSPVRQPARAAVLYVHPFAEELNKSRRMAAVQARALAAAGCVVLQMDLLGCGDSSGDFGDADWCEWEDDVVAAAHWLRRHHELPFWLWGLRAGCLLANAAAPRLGFACDQLYWQPPSTGRMLLQQFLRLRLASDLRGDGASGGVEALRRRLAVGESVEVAGYMLSAGLASGLENAVLAAPERSGRVVWLEVGADADSTFSPASERTIASWRGAGIDVEGRRVQGPAFWQTSEIEEAPALIDASVAALVASRAVPVTA